MVDLAFFFFFLSVSLFCEQAGSQGRGLVRDGGCASFWVGVSPQIQIHFAENVVVPRESLVVDWPADGNMSPEEYEPGVHQS